MLLTQTITHVHRAAHLDIPTQFGFAIGTTILIPTGRFFDTLIDADYAYHAIQLYISRALVKYPVLSKFSGLH